MSRIKLIVTGETTLTLVEITITDLLGMSRVMTLLRAKKLDTENIPEALLFPLDNVRKWTDEKNTTHR